MIDLKNAYEIRNVIDNKLIEKIEDELGNIIYEAWKELTKSGVPPITLQKCKNANLVDYKIYGDSTQNPNENLFDVNTMSERIYAYIPNESWWYYSDDSYSVKVPVQPNTTYRITTESNVNIFRAGCLEIDETPTWSKNIPLVNVVRYGSNTPIELTTTENTLYLVIQIPAAKAEEVFKTLKVSLGTGNPTPNNPIEVISVGIKSKNLVDYTKAKARSGQSIIIDKENNGVIWSGNYYFEIPVYVPKGKTLYLNAEGKKASGWTVLYEDNTYSSSISLNTKITLPKNAKAVRIYKTNPTTTEKDMLITNIMLSEERITKYEPFGYRIPVKVSGKNILNADALSNFTKQEDGSYLSNTTIISTNNVAENLKGVYTISLKLKSPVGANYRLWVYYSDGTTGQQYKASTGDYIEFSHTTNGKDIDRIAWYYSANSNQVQFKDFQIERGNTKTKYEPYVEPTITDIYIKEPLRRITDYADYIDFKNGLVIRRIGYREFNGTETWTYEQLTYGNNFYTYINDSLRDTNTPVLSNMLQYYALGELKPDYACKISGYSGNLNVRYQDFTNVTDLKTKLAEFYDVGEPMNVCYVLETETPEEVDLPNILLNKGTNIIEVDTDILPSNMEITYKGKK